MLVDRQEKSTDPTQIAVIEAICTGPENRLSGKIMSTWLPIVVVAAIVVLYAVLKSKGVIK